MAPMMLLNDSMKPPVSVQLMAMIQPQHQLGIYLCFTWFFLDCCCALLRALCLHCIHVFWLFYVVASVCNLSLLFVLKCDYISWYFASILISQSIASCVIYFLSSRRLFCQVSRPVLYLHQLLNAVCVKSRCEQSLLDYEPTGCFPSSD
jgi:hypothetical protein